MDIFEYAKSTDADYMDMNNGYIYRVQDYNRDKRLGVDTNVIEVCDFEGNYIGVVKEA